MSMIEMDVSIEYEKGDQLFEIRSLYVTQDDPISKDDVADFVRYEVALYERLFNANDIKRDATRAVIEADPVELIAQAGISNVKAYGGDHLIPVPLPSLDSTSAG